jgi:ABC-type sugar transport system ATPase subunit
VKKRMRALVAARAILRFVRDCRDRGKTVIYSTHVMPEVERLCDRVGIIHGGRLLAEGTVAELRSITIERTLPSARDGSFGSGLVLYRGSQTRATNLTLQDNALCGLQAVSDLTSFDIDGALIARNQVGANLQVAGLVGERLSSALRNERFVGNGQDLVFLDLPVPDGGDPGASP